MKIAITGHRPHKLGNDYDLTSDLIRKIKQELQHIITEYNDIGRDNWTPLSLISGMALGIDTLWAELAIENKIPLIAAIPCSGQDLKWPIKSQKTYQDIITHPNCTRNYISDKPYNSTCMQKRNEWMVDNCNLLIAVWDGTSGGTANCVNYAKSVNKPIIYINPKEL